MSQEQARIHVLGPKIISSTARGFFTNCSPKFFYNNKPLLPVTTVSQSQIKYLLIQHTQFDILVKAKHNQLLVKFEQKSCQQTLETNIKEVIKSRHNIEARMSRIVQDVNMIGQNSNKKENQHMWEAYKARHENQCLQLIQTVLRVTQKIQELQEKNRKLQKQAQTQKESNEALQKQNKRLRLMIKSVKQDKQEDIQKLREELNLLNQTKQEKKENLTISNSYHKISNFHYLADNKSRVITEQVSGFIRSSINRESSRLSKIYE